LLLAKFHFVLKMDAPSLQPSLSYSMAEGLIIQRERTKILETCVLLLSKDATLSGATSVTEPGNISIVTFCSLLQRADKLTVGNIR
jgi:hypothetical protein